MSKKSKHGKAPKGDDAKRVKVSIPAELAQAIEAAGDSVEDTVERLLRSALGKPTADSAKRRFAGFIQDIAGPHMPQLEAIAKDVASKVAKDVATAAAAAALTTFAAKAAGDAKPTRRAAGDAKPTRRAAAPKPAAKKPGPKPRAANPTANTAEPDPTN